MMKNNHKGCGILFVIVTVAMVTQMLFYSDYYYGKKYTDAVVNYELLFCLWIK